MIRTTIATLATLAALAIASPALAQQPAAPTVESRNSACTARAYHVWKPALEAGQMSEAGRVSKNGRRASCQLDVPRIRAAIRAGVIRHPGAATTAAAPQQR